jgi:hypothetical protein
MKRDQAITPSKELTRMSGSAFLSVVRSDIISELVHVQYMYFKGQNTSVASSIVILCYSKLYNNTAD